MNESASAVNASLSFLRQFNFFLLALLCLGLGACASSRQHVPVEEREVGVRPVSSTLPPAASAPGADVAKTLPGAENAGKAGFYTIKPGDTLIRIGLEHGQNWKDIVRWNNMENPNLIEVGQVIRVMPPSVDAASAGAKPVTVARVEAKPLGDSRAPAAAESASPGASSVPSSSAAAPTAAAAPASVPASVPASRESDEDIGWQWPAAGAVVSQFDEGKTKGLAISGKAGDPVLAAADGRVVYAGSGLRGYGNLVIVKHNNTYLTAYAHNQTLLVKEDQPVRKGQRIAEMGSSDAERVQLHFEIRKQGKPIDPAKRLPAR